MFTKVLIANRGEIAVRVIRTLREMGIASVAVYSEADKGSLHVQLADEAVCIGPAKSKDSYLNSMNILSAALTTGAQAVHPGFGFLSENAKFAKMCEECNLTFIGPSWKLINKMGDKSKAKEMMRASKIPVIPGSDGIVKDITEGKKIANKIGYPVMIKAAAGGGGKGMRMATSEKDFENAFKSAGSEAKNAFGDDGLYIEKVIVNPKHVEVQLLADKFGNVIHLGERDCSVQRKNQKMIEEAPCAVISDKLRKSIGKDAVAAAKAVGYENAGTIEFLLDKDGNYYFMEMNTRIQVEHPVTEMITGIDIVKQQVLIAAGEKMQYTQNDVKIVGHAIECRVNAEDASNGFRPSPGKIKSLHIPGGNGIRVDSFLFQGYSIPAHYDSMLAKLIVYAPTRDEAIMKMKRALGEFIIDGVITNVDYHFQIMENDVYKSGIYDTGFIENNMNHCGG